MLLGFLRLALGLSLLGFLFSKLEPQEVLASLAGASVTPLLLAIAWQVAAKVVWTLRWKAILRASGETKGFWGLLRLLLIGLFFNFFMPTSIGGDLVRGYYSSGRGGDRHTAYAVVFVERALGLITLVAMAAVASVVLLRVGSPMLPASVLVTVALFGSATTVAGCVAFAWQGWRRWLAARLAPDSRFHRVLAVLALFKRPETPRLRIVAYSLALQIVAVLFYLASARTVGIATPGPTFFLVVPAAATAAMLPITVNGLGLREGTFVKLLTSAGAAPAQAGSCVVLTLLIDTAFALIGGLLYAFYRRGEGAEPREAEPQ